MNESVQKKTLPRGQKERFDFPRFGVPDYAHFMPPATNTYAMQINGDLRAQTLTQQDLKTLERVDLIADFHCVTTWTYRDVHWSGFRFRDFYEQFLQPQLAEDTEMIFATFAGLDRYRASLPLTDALAQDVLLVDRMDGQLLSSEHGAPLRLLAPTHYGYKSVKHLSKIGVWHNIHDQKRGLRKFMEHPRGRVAFEERGRFFPGWLLRFVYRPLIAWTIRQFEDNAQTEHVQAKNMNPEVPLT